MFVNNPTAWAAARKYYRTHPVEWINDWASTVDPRLAGQGKPTTMPFILFKRQREFIEFLKACLDGEANGLCEKSRDIGATWLCVAFSVWLLFNVPGSAVGWGSRKAELVDRIGDMSSIFEKMRALIRSLPRVMWPDGFTEANMGFMKITCPVLGTSITGESGDNIGRGGRTLIYFKDEAAHYEHPEAVEASLADNTRVQIDISSVNGLGNVFHRKREAGVDWEPGQPVSKTQSNVFVFDWSDHPGKTQEWYDQREKNAIEDGLLHLFRQEVDRNYAASVEGVIIPAEWVKSAIDAHLQIKGMEDGGRIAGNDIADSGGDRNSVAIRVGAVLVALDEWGDRDTGVAARRVIEKVSPYAPIEVMYDSVGVGAGVKAETNRLNDEGLMPKGVEFISWNAGAAVLFPDKNVDPDDRDTPLNKDFYQNMKAQGWWTLRRRFEKTHRAITEGAKYPADELISISSDLPLLRKLQKELSQPTASKGGLRLKMVVDKQPEGTRSPNLADAVMMAYWPITSLYDSSMDWVGSYTPITKRYA